MFKNKLELTLKITISFEELQETFMNLLNKFFSLKETKAKYNKQENICVSLTRKAKRDYYQSLDLNNMCNIRKFWATVKPLFSNKIKLAKNIVLG